MCCHEWQKALAVSTSSYHANASCLCCSCCWQLLNSHSLAECGLTLMTLLPCTGRTVLPHRHPTPTAPLLLPGLLLPTPHLLPSPTPLPAARCMTKPLPPPHSLPLICCQVRVTSVADVVALGKQPAVLRARDITRSLEPSFFVPGVQYCFKDTRVVAEVRLGGLCFKDTRVVAEVRRGFCLASRAPSHKGADDRGLLHPGEPPHAQPSGPPLFTPPTPLFDTSRPPPGAHDRGLLHP